jgi:hypothetical protein
VHWLQWASTNFHTTGRHQPQRRTARDDGWTTDEEEKEGRMRGPRRIHVIFPFAPFISHYYCILCIFLPNPITLIICQHCLVFVYS